MSFWTKKSESPKTFIFEFENVQNVRVEKWSLKIAWKPDIFWVKIKEGILWKVPYTRYSQAKNAFVWSVSISKLPDIRYFLSKMHILVTIFHDVYVAHYMTYLKLPVKKMPPIYVCIGFSPSLTVYTVVIEEYMSCEHCS